MATWTPSALVSDIRGLLGNQVFSFQKGVHYIKTHNPSPYNPQTAAQQASRNNFAEISAWWYGLTDEHQQLWHKFASLQERPLTGYNAFVGVNMALYTSGIPSPPRRNFPPQTPDTPDAVRSFQVTPGSPTQNTLSWTIPNDATLYVQSWRRFDWNYYTEYNPAWNILAATLSTQLSQVHNHDTPSGARIWYRLRSIDLWGRQSPYTHTIKVTVPEPSLYVCDTSNYRIKKHRASTLAYLQKIGSLGTGNDQFNDPAGITVDHTHFYLCDEGNHRIQKRLNYDLSFVAKIGTEGSGDDQFDQPQGIAADDTHLFICDRYNHRIKKHLKSDLSYVAQIGSLGTGNNDFNQPAGIAVDDTHLFICDRYNHRIKKHLKSDLSYVAQIGSQGAGNDQFEQPAGIAVDDTHVYICDKANDRIKKHLKSDLSYVAKIGSQGPGDDQFSDPLGIAVNDTLLYICDQNNDRIKKHLKSDLSYVAKLGTEGSGDDQFYNPWGIAVDD